MPQTEQPRRILALGASEADEVLRAARTLPPDGHIICIEGDRETAARAIARFADAGLSARASVMVGAPALFVRKVAGPFDLIIVAPGLELPERAAAHLRAILAPNGRMDAAWNTHPSKPSGNSGKK